MISFLNPAGGFRYHLRAFQYSNTLWTPFRNALGLWLESWNPRSKKLLIIGSSAGYSLTDEWLDQFEQVTCLDPDPLAKLLY